MGRGRQWEGQGKAVMKKHEGGRIHAALAVVHCPKEEEEEGEHTRGRQ